MDFPKDRKNDPESDDGAKVRLLYQTLLEAWNDKDAHEMAELFSENGNVVGFDGSQMDGRKQIESVLGQIFADHPTPVYVAGVRGVRFLAPGVALLRAVAGMVPRGHSDINPALNAVQSLIATKEQGRWRIALFQNTPAAFHGRAELSEQLTAELRQALRASSSGS
jgi:uncharacterized protein (TIGR02246 family)